MRLTALELPASWGTPDRALADVEDRLARGPATELVLLPEAALQGYVSPAGDFDAARHAEPIDGPIARACAALAVRHRVQLVAPLILRDGAHTFNAMIAYAPDGTTTFVYRKRRPWFPETWATAGPDAPPVAMLGTLPTTIAICYDVHFLASDAEASLAAAQLLLFPSAWVADPDTPIADPDSRVALLQRIARRYRVHILNANWAPGVVAVPGQGGSCAIAPDGTVIATAPLGGRVDLTIP